MALTRKLLKDMQLEDPIIEQIIAAHAASIQALEQQRDEALAQAAALNEASHAAAQVQADFDAYRASVESAAQTAKAARLLRLALIQAGCNEQAIELMIRTLPPASLALENGCLVNEKGLIASLKEQYAAFFAKPVRLPTPTIQPPVSSGGALTREDLSRMSAEEINTNWNAVKGVLSKGAM